MTQLTTINRICEHLEKYVFDKIWNDPYTEYRTFFTPECLTEVATTGIFFGRYSRVQLPSEVDYKSGNRLFFYVYAIPAAVFRTLRLNVNKTWTRLDTFCTDHLIDLEFFCQYTQTSDKTPIVGKTYHIFDEDGHTTTVFVDGESFKTGVTYYDPSGRKAVRSSVFVRQADKNDCFLIAVEKTAFTACFGASAKPNDRFGFGKYFDSDLTTSVQYECKRLTNDDIPAYQKSGSPYDPITKSGDPTYTLYNGRLLTGTFEEYKEYLASGAFVEKAYDENILDIFDVCVTDFQHTYIGENGRMRVLIHIPKSTNPGHVIITPNTCDLYLVPTEMEEGAGYPCISGVYLYQCGNEEHFHQITHNDFGIDTEWLSALAKSYGFVKYNIRVMVRSMDKTKTAIRDANYINILYIHEDEDIEQFLLGKSSYNMPFWSARHLELGLYSKSLLRRRDTKPNASDQCAQCALTGYCDQYPITDRQCPTFSRRSLNDYIDNVGYYHTLALIGKRVTHFEVVNDVLGVKYRVTEDTIAQRNKAYYVVDENQKLVQLEISWTDPLPTGTKVYEEVTSTSAAINEFVVRAPLALLDLQPTDYKAVVYHNGLRVDDENISILTGTNADNMYHQELEFTSDATWWTKVIDVNYAQRLRVVVANTEFNIGDKVVVELFDNRHDGQMKFIQLPELDCVETSDTTFLNGTKYYVKHNNQFVKAKLTDEQIGLPIDGTEYDVGIYEIEFTQTTDTTRVKDKSYYVVDATFAEGYRDASDAKGDFNADGSFKSGTTYYERNTGDPVLFSIFYELKPEILDQFTIQMVTEDEWSIHRINDEQDVPYEKTGDTKFTNGRTYYILYPGSGNQFCRVQNSASFEGLPIDGVHAYNCTIAESATPISAKVFYELVDYYKVNNIAFYKIQNPGTFDKTTKKLVLSERLAGQQIEVVEGPLFFEDEGTRNVGHTSTGYMGDDIWKRPDLTHDNYPLDSEIVFLNNHRLIRGLDYTTEGYIPGDFCNGAKLYLQSVSYLKHESVYQILRTCQSTLSNQRGYIKGDIIQWNHSNPFWFDELSILTINGEVCSNIKHNLGTITITDPNDHDNGTPFEFRMSVSTKIKNLLGNYNEDVDRERIGLIKAYFDERFRRPDYITVVKKAHKIYSLYMAQIICAYVRDPNFDFVLNPKIISFEEQFKMFTDWKRRDVAYILDAEDMKYVDVYPIFNRLQMEDRYQYNKISELVRRLRPTDKYQHKDANNVK